MEPSGIPSPSEADLEGIVRGLSEKGREWGSASPERIDDLLLETVRSLPDHFETSLRCVVEDLRAPVSSVLASNLLVLARSLLEYRLTFRHLRRGRRPPLPIETWNGRLAVRSFPHPEIPSDGLLLPGAFCRIILKAGVTAEEVRSAAGGRYFAEEGIAGAAVSLSPFNGFQIGMEDALYLMIEQRLPTVLKANEKTPHAAKVFEKILAPFLRADVLRVVRGGPRTGEALTRMPGVARVHLTGSFHTAGRVRSQLSEGVRFSSELGGLTPIILDYPLGGPMDWLGAARQIDFMSNDNNGQQCVSGQIVLVPEGAAERLAAAMKEIFRRKRCGDPFLPDGSYDHRMEVGPVIHEEAVERYHRLRQDAESRGLRAVTACPVQGRLIPPTVVHGRFDPGLGLLREEAFSPLAAVLELPGSNEREYRVRVLSLLNGLREEGDLAAAFLTPSPLKPEVVDFFMKLPYGLIGVNGWPGIIRMMGPWGGHGGSRRSGNCFTRNHWMIEEDQIEKVVFVFPSFGRQGWGGLKLWQAPWLSPVNHWTTDFLRSLTGFYIGLGSDARRNGRGGIGQAMFCAAMRELTTFPSRAAVAARLFFS